MNLFKRSLLGFLLLTLAAAFAGCLSAPKDSAIPWSQPASWEGQIPGMSSSGVTR